MGRYWLIERDLYHVFCLLASSGNLFPASTLSSAAWCVPPSNFKDFDSYPDVLSGFFFLSPFVSISLFSSCFFLSSFFPSSSFSFDVNINTLNPWRYRDWSPDGAARRPNLGLRRTSAGFVGPDARGCLPGPAGASRGQPATAYQTAGLALSGLHCSVMRPRCQPSAHCFRVPQPSPASAQHSGAQPSTKAATGSISCPSAHSSPL